MVKLIKMLCAFLATVFHLGTEQQIVAH